MVPVRKFFIPILGVAIALSAGPACSSHPGISADEAGAPSLLTDASPTPHLGQTLWLRQQLEILRSELKDTSNPNRPIDHWIKVSQRVLSWTDFPATSWREDLQEEVIESEISIRNHVISTIRSNLKKGHTWATLRLIKHFQGPPLIRSERMPGMGPSYEQTLMVGRKQCEGALKDLQAYPKAEVLARLMGHYCLQFDPSGKERFSQLARKRLTTLYRASQFTRLGEFEPKYDTHGIRSTDLGEKLQGSLKRSPWFDLQADGVLYLMVDLGTDSQSPVWKGHVNLNPIHDLLRWQLRRAEFPETQQLNAYAEELENQLNLKWIQAYCPEAQPTRTPKVVLVDLALRCVRVTPGLRANWVEPVCQAQFGMGCEEILGTLNIASQ